VKTVNSIILLISLLLPTNASTENFKLTEELKGLNLPWSLSFVKSDKLLLTEKSGKLLLANLKNKTVTEIKHNLSVVSTGQGGLLDVLYQEKTVWVSYSEFRGFAGYNKVYTSTSIAKGKFDDSKIIFNNIFRAEPPINSNFHFGSRLVKKGKYLFASVGERGKGMVAQDPKNHLGSIIRIGLDGSIPKDNPKYLSNKEWLPEIYQIGVRNPQGMSLSPVDGNIFISNHGARGGDWFGKVIKGGNYGWKILGWGGTNYNGSKIGPQWKAGFDKAIHYWVPSIAVSAINIYSGDEFKSWRGHALITSLKDKSLRKLIFKDKSRLQEDILFKGKIGRIRDIKIQKETGKIFLLSDSGSLWKMEKI
jgi:glucose/arabinose dehydrogenase|tara:strand:+ start:2446 stop:3534 length:1089 start_codon:yes stop_codon:yes gene_type:complete